MKKSHQNIIIISAELADNRYESNRQRTLNLKGCLEDCNISHGESIGLSKGFLGVVFVCLPKSQEEIQVLKDFAFENFKQESILEQDVNGFCHEVFADDSSEILGRFNPVTSKDNLKSYTQINGVIYTTEEL